MTGARLVRDRLAQCAARSRTRRVRVMAVAGSPNQPEFMQVVTNDGTRLYAEVDGPSDAPLTAIFCHGIGDSLETWRAQRTRLADSPIRRVFYDHRAFGRSEPGRATPSIDQLARDLRDVISSFEGPVVLIGHSMGGLTIQALGGVAPELFGPKVVANVLMAMPLRGSALTLGAPDWLARPVQRYGIPVLIFLARLTPLRLVWLRSLLARFAQARGTDPALRRELARRVNANPSLVLTTYLTAVLAADTTDAVAALGSVRTVVVLGARDRLVTRKSTVAVAKAVPGAELVVIERSGHMVHTEQPDRVHQILQDVVSTALPVARKSQA